MAEIIPHWLTKQAYLSPNKIAIEAENNVSMTYLELKEASERYAKKLAQAGVTEGSHVGILSSNSIEMVIAVHALSYLGAVTVLLNTRLTNRELTYQITHAEVSVVLIRDDLAEKTKQMEFPIQVKTFSEIDQLKEKTVTMRKEIDLGDIFTIMFTSGTTGSPKGVVHTYGNHWWSAMGSALNLGLDGNDKWLVMLPIFHIGGFSVFMKSVIYGMPVYLLEKFDPKIVNQAIMKHGVTIVSVVTVMLQSMVHALEEKRYPTSLRCMLLGGGPAPKSLLEIAKERGIPVFQSYGLTETSSQIVTLSPEDAFVKIGSAGKPLFPGQLKINNPGVDAVGEIYVKGPMVTKGYFADKAATDKVLQDGWLATGDLGYIDEAGFLYVVDRRTDLIISGGENIYPSEIESVLAGMELIQEVGVIGKEDDIWGQVPIAFVVRKSETVSVDDIIDYAKKHMARYKVPKEIFFVDQLPRNASNKLVRNDLQKMAGK